MPLCHGALEAKAETSRSARAALKGVNELIIMLAGALGGEQLEDTADPTSVALTVIAAIFYFAVKVELQSNRYCLCLKISEPKLFALFHASTGRHRRREAWRAPGGFPVDRWCVHAAFWPVQRVSGSR